MQSEAEIVNRLKTLVTEEFDSRVARAYARLPTSCVHNHIQVLDNRKTVDGVPNENFNRVAPDPHHLQVIQVGLCLLNAASPEEWQGTICEDPIDAKRCPFFTVKVSKDTILADFQSQLQDKDWVKVNMPEAHGLMWVLEAQSLPDLGWWDRLWFRLRPTRVETIEIEIEATDD